MVQPRVNSDSQWIKRYWLMNDYRFNTHDIVDLYSDQENEAYYEDEYAEERTTYIAIDVVLPSIMAGAPEEIEGDIRGNIFNYLSENKLIRLVGGDFQVNKEKVNALPR